MLAARTHARHAARADRGNVVKAPDRRCEFCGRPLDPTSNRNWVRVEMWQKGTATALRQRLDRYACSGCVHLVRAGHTPKQQELFE